MKALRLWTCLAVLGTVGCRGWVGQTQPPDAGKTDGGTDAGVDAGTDAGTDGGVWSGGADNRYCGPGDVPTFGTVDGPAHLPERCVYTAMPIMQADAGTLDVCPSCTYTTVGSAAAVATCGQVIRVQARDSNGAQIVYDEPKPISVATQCGPSSWILVTSDLAADPSFPAEGMRISPCWAGHSSLLARPAFSCPATPGVYVPKIRAPHDNSVLLFGGGTYWRFVGLELTTQPGVNQDHAVAEKDPNVTGLAGDHIVFDRVIAHGADSPPDAGSTTEVSGGISGESMTSVAVIDSYLYDFICVNGCTDAHAVSLGGNDPDIAEGPTKVVNNFLEASGENFFAGGGGTGAGCCQIPVDMEIRRNHSYKPAEIWKLGSPADAGTHCSYSSNDCVDNPTYYGTKTIVKNLGEFKTGARILLEGNVFENNWGGQSDQFGNAFQFNPVSQNIHVYGCATSDGSGNLVSDACDAGVSGKPIQFTSKAVDPNCAVPGQCHVSMGDKPDRATFSLAQTFGSSSAITISPALPPFQGQLVSQCEPGLNPNAQSSDVVVRFNVARHTARGVQITTDKSQCGDLAKQLAHFSVHDNQFDDIDGWKWNLSSGACCAWGSAVLIGNVNHAQVNATSDISIVHNTLMVAQQHIAGTEGAVNISNGCGASCTAQIYPLVVRDNLGGAGMNDNFGTKYDACTGVSPTAALLDCLAGSSATSWCMTGNAFSLATAPELPAPSPNTPWPDGGTGNTSPACPAGIPTFNFAPGDYTGFQMVNLSNANGGDYHLTAASPYKNAASDGQDIGANIDQVSAYTAGVP